MSEDQVIIAGGGIGGFAMALTLRQVGVPCLVPGQVADLKPLGVGINLQPNAVREMMDLGFTAEDMDAFGVPAQGWALVGRQGQEIHSEPRGTYAGYRRPQYAAHRGKLHMALYHRFRDRAGDNNIRPGARATGCRVKDDGTVAVNIESDQGVEEVRGRLLIGASEPARLSSDLVITVTGW